MLRQPRRQVCLRAPPASHSAVTSVLRQAPCPLHSTITLCSHSGPGDWPGCQLVCGAVQSPEVRSQSQACLPRSRKGAGPPPRLGGRPQRDKGTPGSPSQTDTLGSGAAPPVQGPATTGVCQRRAASRCAAAGEAGALRAGRKRLGSAEERGHQNPVSSTPEPSLGEKCGFATCCGTCSTRPACWLPRPQDTMNSRGASRGTAHTGPHPQSSAGPDP